MVALRAIEHFIAQAMTVERKQQILLTVSAKGYQASVQHADGSCVVNIADDPVTALWNVLVPHTMRRVTAPSGRVMIVDAEVAGRAFLGPGVEVGAASEKQVASSHSTGLAELLGGETVKPTHHSGLDGLLG